MDYKKFLSTLLAPISQLPENEIPGIIESPPDPALGHFAFPCFRLAKAMRKAPPVIAADLAAQIMDKPLPEWLAKAVATGPYINFFLDAAIFARQVLGDVLKAGSRYGAPGATGPHCNTDGAAELRYSTDGAAGPRCGTGGAAEPRCDTGRAAENAAKKVLVEYSSPNIAKHFHPGHFANTMIGNSLDRIFRFLGYDVTSINHLGDFGTQFGRLIVAYKRWGSREEIEQTEIDGLVRIYVKFHEEADTDPTLYDEARAWVVKMQDKDAEALALWEWFVELSMRSFNRLYERLGITFDLVRGESYYTDKMAAVVQKIREAGLLEESDGAQIVNLDAYKMPPCLILRSDGGTLYPTRDIAAAINRYETFRFDKSIYITGNEQDLHFAQWMKVVELMGFPWAANMVHISYGRYTFEGGVLSTRRGNTIKVEDLIDEAVAKTLAIIEEKNPTLPNKETVAEQVGIGAMVFSRLYNGRSKDSVFNFAQMLNFEGETGPYVQYTHARTCSVLEKSGAAGELKKTSPASEQGATNFDATPLNDDEIFDATLLTDAEAFNVVRALYDYPTTIADAAEKFEPFLIARHLVALAQAFNAFYHKNIILAEDIPTKTARLTLTRAVQTVLKNGLYLLGIAAPRAM